MSAGEVMEWEIRSDPRELPGVRERMGEWAAAHGWTAEQALEIALAVDEALSNVIRHGYCCECTHRIQITVRSTMDPERGEGLEVRVRDFGRQVDPASIKGRDLDDVRPGGLGVHIIRAMMSSAEYRPAAGGGMLLVMRKYKSHLAAGRDPRAP